MPNGIVVNYFHDQERPREGRVNNPECVPPIGPIGPSLRSLILFGLEIAAPDQMICQDDDQNTANPEYGQKRIGALSLQRGEIQLFSHDG